MTYSELQATTHYSFLRGASSPQQLLSTAAVMGMPALGIVDRNSVAGVVQGLYWSKKLKDEQGLTIRSIPGCRLDLATGDSLLVWPEDRAAWSRLTRLLTVGKLRADPNKGEKGKCFLHWDDVAEHCQGLVGALVPHLSGTDPKTMRWMADLFGTRGHVCLSYLRRPEEKMRLRAVDDDARRFGLTPLATNDVLYHSPDQRMLQDVVTAIREKTTIDSLGFRRERCADRHLLSPEEMARRFRDYPEALAAVEAIVERCTFSVSELSHQYPHEKVMERHTPQRALEIMSWKALRTRFGGHAPAVYRRQLKKELRLVAKWQFAPFFLTVHSIVQYARSQEILCQGRGSAANSLICFVLSVTSIDPIKHKLLFERFLSDSRNEPPDIDVDFEHERREEVIQWIYDTYGRDHAGMTAVVSRFRSRGAIREVGKALGLPEDVTAALASQVWGWSNDGVPEEHVRALNLDASDPRLALALDLAKQLIGTPRHLSQHPGGFVLTHDRLDALLPIEPAAMENRHVIEWEKVDIEFLKFVKVDILGLGMLGCLRRAFELLETKGETLTLDANELQSDDEPTYRMIRQADTLGVFQIESRAQMSMLPRMRPVDFYDLAIQIAIVRPGPIQGDMVHPYLKRREEQRRALEQGKPYKIDYPLDDLAEVLDKTLGVPLFQEQAMNVAIIGAGFTPAEADALRQAMATFKMTGGVGKFRPKLIAGMNKKGINEEFAERLVKQIEGFGSYGFPESHAASFAKIAYASSWMKCHHPDVFCTALLNAQPMGFYAPAQIVRDAREHGVTVQPVCINGSDWDTKLLPAHATDQPRGRFCGTEADWAKLQPIRLGMKIVQGLSHNDADRIVEIRGERLFASIADVRQRTGLPLLALEKLARADAFHGFGFDRRQALWRVKGLGETPLPLFAASNDVSAHGVEPETQLAPLSAGREVVEDYRATQLTLRAHPVSFLRERLAARRIVPCGSLQTARDGARVEVAGLILVRQRPGSAKGVVFVTLEDESGIANAILWADRFEAHRRTVMSATMLGVKGRVQREGIVIHLVAETITDLTGLLHEIGEAELPRMTMPGDGATHGGTIDPRDRKVGWPSAADRRMPGWPKQRALEAWTPRHKREGEEVIPVKSHDFH